MGLKDLPDLRTAVQEAEAVHLKNPSLTDREDRIAKSDQWDGALETAITARDAPALAGALEGSTAAGVDELLEVGELAVGAVGERCKAVRVAR